MYGAAGYQRDGGGNWMLIVDGGGPPPGSARWNKLSVVFQMKAKQIRLFNIKSG